MNLVLSDFFWSTLVFSNFKLPSFNIRFTHAALRPLPLFTVRIKTNAAQQCSIIGIKNEWRRHKKSRP
jgi:hypothetical protein